MEQRRRANSISSLGHPTKRIESLISQARSGRLSETVLNRGLGALNTRLMRDGSKSGKKPGLSPGHVLCVFGAVITISSAVTINAHFLHVGTEDFWTHDPARIKAGLTRVAAIPLACTAVNLLMLHIRKTTFWWENGEHKESRLPSSPTERGSPGSPRRTLSYWSVIKTQMKENDTASAVYGFDPLAFWPMVVAALTLLRSASTKLVADSGTATEIAFYLEISMSFIGLRVYYALLDAIHAIIQGMKTEQEAINLQAPVQKMQGIIRNITRTRRPEKDVVYCFAQTNTVPAEVLSYVWWLYYIGGKVLGAGLVAFMLMGVEESILERVLIGGFMISLATASGFLFELGPNTLSLLRLSLNKPFYVGDLITLNTDGAMDAPDKSIMGFVENITMMYVVIRNFEMKQTWIPHKAFSGMIIQNWTRRPSKTVKMSIGISCRCPVKQVQRLTAFGMKWIEHSPEIQKENYRKCHVTKSANGFNIEIIFYPGVGVSHRGIRQKFLWSFMAAAQRMNIPFVPVQTMSNFPAYGQEDFPQHDYSAPHMPDHSASPFAHPSDHALTAIAETSADLEAGQCNVEIGPSDFRLPAPALQPRRGRPSPPMSPELASMDMRRRGCNTVVTSSLGSLEASPDQRVGAYWAPQEEVVDHTPVSPAPGGASPSATGKLKFARYQFPSDGQLDNLLPDPLDLLATSPGPKLASGSKLREEFHEAAGHDQASACGAIPEEEEEPGQQSAPRSRFGAYAAKASVATPKSPLRDDVFMKREEVDLSEFEDLLPDPNDLLPKGVGMGFAKFPEGCKDME